MLAMLVAMQLMVTASTLCNVHITITKYFCITITYFHSIGERKNKRVALLIPAGAINCFLFEIESRILRLYCV